MPCRLGMAFFLKLKQMSNKTRNVVVTLKPATGQTNVTHNFQLPAGKLVSVCALSNGKEKETTGGIPQSMIFIALKDDANGEIIPMLPLKLWEQTAGEYEKSFKPLKMDTLNKTYTLVMNTQRETTDNAAVDITAWVVFNYEP